MSEAYRRLEYSLAKVTAFVLEPRSAVSHMTQGDSWGVRHLDLLSDQRQAFLLFSLVGESGWCKPIATVKKIWSQRSGRLEGLSHLETWSSSLVLQSSKKEIPSFPPCPFLLSLSLPSLPFFLPISFPLFFSHNGASSLEPSILSNCFITEVHPRPIPVSG